MIKFNKISNEIPYKIFKKLYTKSKKANQTNIEAMCIASYFSKNDEVNARFVNLKMVNNKEFIFFSNYSSQKSKDFVSNSNITSLIYWNTTNTQIRMKARVKKTSRDFNQTYFRSRDIKKNALAISSNQSKTIESYNQVIKNYNKSLKHDDLKKCPDFWGGYSFIPYYFEFWEGHESRLNKREVYVKVDGVWKKSFLQP